MRKLLHHAARRAWVALVAILFLAGTAQAQGTLVEMGTGLLFNHTDVGMEFGAGVSFMKLGISAKADFQSRIGTKRVLVETDTPNLLYQFHERRYFLGVDLDKRFILTDLGEDLSLGLYIGGLAGMRFNDYRGTDEKGTVDFGWQAKAGACLVNPEAFILRMGYQYVPLPTSNVFPHRICISINFLLYDAF